MGHLPVAALLAELRRCVPSRRRPARGAHLPALLAQLLDACHVLGIEERAGSIVFRLQTGGEPAVRISCVLHHSSSVPLTAAEAAVAEGMCAGRTLAQIAGARGVSVNTVKSQARQVFRKLEVDSRVALVRLLAP